MRYSSRPSQTAAEPFSLSPVGNPSGSCQLQPHGNLTPALSPGHSRVSIIIPPACHRLPKGHCTSMVGLFIPMARRSLGNGSAVPDQLVFNCQRSVLHNRVTKSDCRIRHSATLVRYGQDGFLNVLKIPCMTACSSAVNVSDTFSSRTSWESVKYFLPRRKPSAIRTPPFVPRLRVIG